MTTKPLTRWELVNALRSYEHPSDYHRAIQGPTAALRARLAFHTSTKAEKQDGEWRSGGNWVGIAVKIVTA
jgi:hypothetical protein